MCLYTTYMNSIFYILNGFLIYIQIIPENEKLIIDKIIDDGVQKAGDLDAKDVKGKLFCQYVVNFLFINSFYEAPGIL